ncbi:hypothetical protein NF212_21590 [Parasalinivibrio latis]|uniref:hypothetical protein n=1 Tax=Parasalinivibrio latis TaxID=2952610 RepID=UPI0030E0EDAE
MNTRYLSQPLSDDERSDLLFKGDVAVFTRVPAMKALIRFTDSMLRYYLDGNNPVTAHQDMLPGTFLNRIGAAQRDIHRSDEAKSLFFGALRQCGMDLDDAFYDHFVLRVVPCHPSFEGAWNSAIGHHRDTWGSNIYCQQNWWAPIYGLEPGRSIAIYPDYWRRPLANTSNKWSFKEFLSQRSSAPKNTRCAYPSVPQPLEPIDETNRISMDVSPGDILCFSSAHLHASRINRTREIRYSIEMRTVNRIDLAEGRKAPNIDNDGTDPMYGWFKGITDHAPLALEVA